MRKLLLSISYDGTDFHGWQRQPQIRTVQQVLEDKISYLTGEEIKILGCSRTDAGVHASDQKVTFITNNRIPINRVTKALNGILPRDIMIVDSKEVSLDFHPRFQAVQKRYGYTINTNEIIDYRHRRYCWHLNETLDVLEMQRAATYLLGEHDFATFCAAGSQVESTVRTIFRAEVMQKGSGEVYFYVVGNGFLYKMVRILVGSLVDIGIGKHSASYLSQAIESKQRSFATRTAPPGGLCLEKVWFNKENLNNSLT